MSTINYTTLGASLQDEPDVRHAQGNASCARKAV
jgi:hypothetical protein